MIPSKRALSTALMFSHTYVISRCLCMIHALTPRTWIVSISLQLPYIVVHLKNDLIFSIMRIAAASYDLGGSVTEIKDQLYFRTEDGLKPIPYPLMTDIFHRMNFEDLINIFRRCLHLTWTQSGFTADDMFLLT